MTVATFTADLARFGPQETAASRGMSLAEAKAYCRNLARTHYENFSVTSILLPRELREHFYPIYAYCRWADDLADEVADSARSETLLNWWEEQLDACYAGESRHPVFVALGEAIRQFSIPRDPFANLLVAFHQDQIQTRYTTPAELIGYCVNSANPVGRLVLHLGRCHTPERVALSDSICTGLQLANFCQDVARDFERGRIYLPQESWQVAGCNETTFENRAASDSFRKLLKIEVDRAEAFLRAGAELPSLMPRDLQLQIALFIEGGLATVQKIRDLDYNVWSQRPRVTKWDKLRIVWNCWRRTRHMANGESP